MIYDGVIALRLVFGAVPLPFIDSRQIIQHRKRICDSGFKKLKHFGQVRRIYPQRGNPIADGLYTNRILRKSIIEFCYKIVMSLHKVVLDRLSVQFLKIISSTDKAVLSTPYLNIDYETRKLSDLRMYTSNFSFSINTNEIRSRLPV